MVPSIFGLSGWAISPGQSLKISLKYSVMQSDGNSFCGDVVLNSGNIANSDKDSLLYEIYEKQIFFDLNLRF